MHLEFSAVLTQPQFTDKNNHNEIIAKDVRHLMISLKLSMNPFSLKIDPGNLFNIITWKAVSDDTSKFLLSAK